LSHGGTYIHAVKRCNQHLHIAEDGAYPDPQPHPLSAAVATEELKGYLRDDRSDIRLHDLIVRETEAAVAVLCGTGPSRLTRLLRRPSSHRACHVMRRPPKPFAIFLWRERIGEQMTKAFRSIAAWQDTGTGNIAPWLDLKIYPALLLLYSLGIGYVASDKYGSLDRLLRMEMVHRFDPSQAAGRFAVVFDRRVAMPDLYLAA
jgi:hypothetical protein